MTKKRRISKTHDITLNNVGKYKKTSGQNESTKAPMRPDVCRTKDGVRLINEVNMITVWNGKKGTYLGPPVEQNTGGLTFSGD